MTPFQVQHGDPACTPFPGLQDTDEPVNEDKELALPALFAEAVAVSTKFFCRLAQTHDEFVRRETALRLNKSARSPHSGANASDGPAGQTHHNQRGVARVLLSSLSPTAYVAVDDVSKRRYGRLIANLLPYRAKQAKVTNNARDFNEQYSDPFIVGEYIAIRDDKTEPFYVVEITAVTLRAMTLHYYGCREVLLPNVVFRPCWPPATTDPDPAITLSPTTPLNQIPYSGTVDLKGIRHVLVARKLNFTSAWKLRLCAQRALAPVQGQLFRFAR